MYSKNWPVTRVSDMSEISIFSFSMSSSNTSSGPSNVCSFTAYIRLLKFKKYCIVVFNGKNILYFQKHSPYHRGYRHPVSFALRGAFCALRSRFYRYDMAGARVSFFVVLRAVGDHLPYRRPV